MHMKLRSVFSIKDAAVLAVGSAVAGVFTYINRVSPAGNICNFIFFLGLIYISVGFSVYVKNAGLFKTFSYMRYKSRFRGVGEPDPRNRPLSMAGYALEQARKKSSLAEYFIVGVPLLVIAYIMAFNLY